MARIRTFKPSVFDHEELCDLENLRPELRPVAVFLGLMCCADKAGRFVWSPRKLKLTVLPFVDYDLEATMAALLDHGFLRSYEVDGKRYGCFPTWGIHQRPHHQEPDSILPAPLELDFGDSPKSIGDSPKPLGESRGELGAAPNGREGKGREKEGEEEGKQEGSISPSAPAAAWTLGLSPWIERELQGVGLSLRSAKVALAKVGAEGLPPALAKLRAKGAKGENPAGLLLSRCVELADEGRALLAANLTRATRQAPRALAESAWRNLPPVVREDPEAQAAWCVFRAAETALAGATEPNRADLSGVKGHAQNLLVELLRLRHPEGARLWEQATLEATGCPQATHNRVRDVTLLRALGIAPVRAVGGS